MNINIKNTNLELTPAIADYLNKRLEDVSRLVDVVDSGAHCQVEIGKTTNHHKTGDIFRAELNIRLKGEVVYVVEDSADLYASIDTVKDEAIKKIKRFKSKRQTLYRKGKSVIKNILRFGRPQQ